MDARVSGEIEIALAAIRTATPSSAVWAAHPMEA